MTRARTPWRWSSTVGASIATWTCRLTCTAPCASPTRWAASSPARFATPTNAGSWSAPAPGAKPLQCALRRHRLLGEPAGVEQFVVGAGHAHHQRVPALAVAVDQAADAALVPEPEMLIEGDGAGVEGVDFEVDLGVVQLAEEEAQQQARGLA